MTIQQAAKTIGISRQALYRRLKEYPNLCSKGTDGKLYLTTEQVKAFYKLVNRVNMDVTHIVNSKGETAPIVDSFTGYVDTADNSDSFSDNIVTLPLHVNDDVNRQVDEPIRDNSSATATPQPTDKPLKMALLQIEIDNLKAENARLQSQIEATIQQVDDTQKKLDAAMDRDLQHIAKIESYADRFSELAMAAHIQKKIEAQKQPGMLARLFSKLKW